MLYVTGFVVLVAISAEYLYFNQGDSISTQYRKGGFNSIVDGEFFIETLILSLPGSLIFVLWSQFSYLARTMNSCIHTFCVQVWFISLLTIMVTIAVDGIMYALILVMISFGVITLIGFVALCYLFMPLFVEVTRWFEIMRGYHGCSDVGLWFDLILSAFKCIGLCKLGGRKHYVFHQLNDEPEENDPVEDAYYTFTDDKRVYYAKVLYVRNDNTYDIQYVRDNDPQIIKSIMTNGVDSVLENYRTCYVKYDEISAAIEVFDTETIDTFKEQYEIGDVVKLKRRRRPCNFIVPHGQVKVENSHVGRLPYHSMYYTDCYVDIAMSCTVVAVNLQEGSFDIQAEISELKKRYYRVIPDGTGDYLSYRARLVILRDDHKVDNSMGSKSIAGAEMNSEKSNFSIEDYPVDVQTVSVKYNKQFNFSKAKSKKGSGSNFSTNVRHKVGEILTIFDCNCQIIRRSSHSKWYCKIKNSSFYTEKDYAPISHLHPKNIVDATLYYDRLVTILPERGDDYVTTANRPSDFNLSDVSDQTRNPIALSPRLGTVSIIIFMILISFLTLTEEIF